MTRSLHVLEGGFADEAVVTDALDVEQTPIGCEADFTQFVEIFDAPADGEVAGVVDRGFGSKLPRRKFLHLVVGATAMPRIAGARAYPTRPARVEIFATTEKSAKVIALSGAPAE